MKRLALITATAVALALPATAQQAKRSELSLPIVAYTPVIAKNADALQLNEEQLSALKAWLDTMPAQRKALEGEAIALRAKLRDAINADSPQEDRQALAEQIGDAETRLVMMRSACTDHWRGILTPEQFAMMQEIAMAQ